MACKKAVENQIGQKMEEVTDRMKGSNADV